MELAPLTVLNKQYTIKRTLGEPGPFDIRYLGETVDAKTATVIREFFPVHLVDRESGTTSVDVRNVDEHEQLFTSGVTYFQKESEVLSQLDHEALPSGYDVFESNGTAYRARPHVQSIPLRKGLERRDTLSEKAALAIMVPILEALQVAHENGLYHGGVSPETVRLCQDGSVLLTGFRGAFIQLARQGGELSALIQPGTSAIEQYTPRGNQGPWTDVYAAAATICFMVTGRELPEASDRIEGTDPLADWVQDAEAFSSPGVREALIDALEVDPSKRLQSAEALATALKESSTKYDRSESPVSIVPTPTEDIPSRDDDAEASEEEVEVLSTGESKSTRMDRGARKRQGHRDERKKESSNRTLYIALPVLAVVLGIGGYFMMASGGSASTAPPTPGGSQPESASQQVSQVDPAPSPENESRLRERVAEGDSLLAAADASYADGDSRKALQLYSEARSRFFAAQDLRAQESVESRIDRINQRQDQIFETLQSSDEGSSNEVQALIRQQRRAERARSQAIYERALERGRGYMRDQEYAQAKSAFQQASDARRTGEVVRAISRADSLLQVKRENQTAYERFRVQADLALQEGNYEDAVDLYRKALDAKSGDAYAQEQLERAKGELEAIQLAQAKKKKDAKRRENMRDGDIYTVVDEEARVEGGLAALHQNVRYPESAARRGDKGRVYMQAIVEADGSVREATVTRGVSRALNQEALRVVRRADFIPAKVDGKPVPSRTAVWIEFDMGDDS